MTVTHVLDASAVLAHFFDEAGAAGVQQLFSDKRARAAMPASALVELARRIHEEVPDEDEARRACSAYAEELVAALPVDSRVMRAAFELIARLNGRLSPEEAITAAAARLHHAVLVHCNPRFDALPASYVETLALAPTVDANAGSRAVRGE